MFKQKITRNTLRLKWVSYRNSYRLQCLEPYIANAILLFGVVAAAFFAVCTQFIDLNIPNTSILSKLSISTGIILSAILVHLGNCWKQRQDAIHAELESQKGLEIDVRLRVIVPSGTPLPHFLNQQFAVRLRYKKIDPARDFDTERKQLYESRLIGHFYKNSGEWDGLTFPRFQYQ